VSERKLAASPAAAIKGRPTKRDRRLIHVLLTNEAHQFPPVPPQGAGKRIESWNREPSFMTVLQRLRFPAPRVALAAALVALAALGFAQPRR